MQGISEDEEVKRIRAKLLEEVKDTTFRPQIWSDHPIRAPIGEAEIQLKPGGIPVKQRPFMLTGGRREATTKFYSGIRGLGNTGAE